MLETIFGETLINADGRTVPVRLIGEQHVREDLGSIPSFADWARLITPQAWMLRGHRDGTRQLALVTAANLLVNLAFFLTHPVFTPYYTVPVAMLSLWSLLFASLKQPANSVELAVPGRWTAPLPDAIPRP